MNYERIYNQIIERANNRIIEGYTEKHHIIPKCMGGNDIKTNIVRLTPKEHYLCHRLLCEIYPSKNGLVFAYWMMCKAASKGQEREYRITAREYERLRVEYSRVLKERPIWNKGLTKEDERVAKYGNAKRWNSGLKKGENPILDELHRKATESRKGKPLSNNHKTNISKALKGRLVSDETKQKLAESLKGNLPSKYWKMHICPKCGKIGKGPNMKRYHFENCRV